MTPNPQPSTEVAATAAEWLAKHDRGLSPQEAAEFHQWRNADPQHAEEWDSMHNTWKQVDDLELLPELVARAAAIDEHTHTAAARRATFRRYVPLVLAAAAAVVVGMTVWRSRIGSEPEAGPAVNFVAAESRALQLPDGSVVLVRGDSKVSHDFSGTERRVILGAGEAFFSVAKDPTHPFIVEASGVAVRAVGTAFNVRRDNNGINLIVTEGRVRVATKRTTEESSPLITAGQKMQVEARTAPSASAAVPITPGEIEAELKWRSPQLEFNHASLSRVLAAFGEHSSQRIQLGDPSLAQREISGTFQADNIEGFLRLAELSFGMKVERGANGFITLYQAR